MSAFAHTVMLRRSEQFIGFTLYHMLILFDLCISFVVGYVEWYVTQDYSTLCDFLIHAKISVGVAVLCDYLFYDLYIFLIIV